MRDQENKLELLCTNPVRWVYTNPGLDEEKEQNMKKTIVLELS